MVRVQKKDGEQGQYHKRPKEHVVLFLLDKQPSTYPTSRTTFKQM